MTVISILATIMGVVMSLGYYPQAYKIWRRKSADDISITSYIIFFSGTSTWLVYGIITGDYPIIISFVLGVIGSFTVLLLAIRYRKTGP